MIERFHAALADRYVIEQKLGEGGMATVFLAEDPRHHRKVALEVLKPELAAVVGAERFLSEIETTARLQHPHILPLFDSGEADDFLFYVVPFAGREMLSPDGRWRISTGAGYEPSWAPDGSRLFFRSAEGLVAVDVLGGPSFRTGPVSLVFAEGTSSIRLLAPGGPTPSPARTPSPRDDA